MRLPEGDPFQALADPSRRAIIDLLSKNKKTINALAENFEMSRPAVSKHVKILTAAGFIFIEDIGRERYCSLNADGFNAVHDWFKVSDIKIPFAHFITISKCFPYLLNRCIVELFNNNRHIFDFFIVELKKRDQRRNVDDNKLLPKVYRFFFLRPCFWFPKNLSSACNFTVQNCS